MHHPPPSLFRREAIEHRRVDALGRTIPLYARDALAPVLILLAIVIGAGIVLTRGSYARSVVASGWVIPDGPTARILSPQRGVLTGLHVRDGQHVAKGTPLATIDIQTANSLSADPAGRALDLLRRERRQVRERETLARGTADADHQRLQDVAVQLRRQRAAIDRQVTLQRTRVSSAQSTFGILSDARRKNYVSRIELENQRRTLLDERARLQELIGQQATIGAELDDNRASLRRLPLDLGGKLADLQDSAATLDRRRLDIESARSIVLTAPIAGEIAALQPRIGQTVTPDIPLLYLLGDKSRLEVELFAPSAAIGFTRPGQEVRLRYDAFPYQQFGTFRGVVVAISRTALAPDEIEAPVKLEAPAYRIRVRLDRQAITAFGARYALQPGMTLSATMILERQSLFDWLMEPINAVRRRH